MYSSEAEAWQNSLHQFIDLTDRNITILQAERDTGQRYGNISKRTAGDRPVDRDRDRKPSHPVLTSNPASVPSYQRPRSSSNARGLQNQYQNQIETNAAVSSPTYNLNGISAAASSNENRRSSVNLPISMAEKENILYEKSQNPSDLSRQFQQIVKKNVFLQEKLKKVEDLNNDLVKNLTTCSSNVERLIEQQKQDKQLIFTMKDQFASLKQQMDVLSSKQQLDKSQKGNRANEIDEDTICERILHKLQHEVKTSIRDYNERHDNDKNEFMKTLHENSMTECRKFFQASNINSHSIRDMEKEILRLRSDTNGMKTKQGYLDTMYNELRDGILIREKEIEDIHRKAISGYKLDMNAVIESVGRRVNDALAGMHTSMKLAEIPALWKRMDELNVAIKAQGQANRVDLLEEKYNDMEMKLQYITSSEFVQNIFEGNMPMLERRFQLGAPMHAPPSNNSRINIFNNWKSDIEAKLKNFEDSSERILDSNANFTQATSQALLDCERKTFDIASHVERLEAMTDKYVIELVEAGKVTRKRIQEIGGTLGGLMKSKQALDDLIVYFDNKMKALGDHEGSLSPLRRGGGKDSASDLNSEKIQGIKTRVDALESEVKVLKTSQITINPSADTNSSVNNLNQSVDTSSTNIATRNEVNIDGKLNELKAYMENEIKRINVDERLVVLESLCMKLDDEVDFLYNGDYNAKSNLILQQYQQQQHMQADYQHPATEAITIPKRSQNSDPRTDRDAFDRLSKLSADPLDDDFEVGGFMSSQLSALETLALQDDLYDSIEGGSRHSDTLFMASDIVNEGMNPSVNASTNNTKSYHTIKPTSPNAPLASVLPYAQKDNKSSSYTVHDASSTQDSSKNISHLSRKQEVHVGSGRADSPQYGAEHEGFADNYQNISNMMSDKNKYNKVKHSRDI